MLDRPQRHQSEQDHRRFGLYSAGICISEEIEGGHYRASKKGDSATLEATLSNQKGEAYGKRGKCEVKHPDRKNIVEPKRPCSQNRRGAKISRERCLDIYDIAVRNAATRDNLRKVIPVRAIDDARLFPELIGQESCQCNKKADQKQRTAIQRLHPDNKVALPGRRRRQ